MHDAGISAAEALYLIDLAETSFRAHDLSELSESFLHGLAKLIKTPAAVLYLETPALPANAFFQMGLLPEAAPRVQSQCAAQFHPEPGRADLQPVPAPLRDASARPTFSVSTPGPRESSGPAGSGDAGA